MNKYTLLICFCVWAWPLSAAQTELSALTRYLPGNYKVEQTTRERPELLSGATRARTTIITSNKVEPDGVQHSLKYTDARYADRAAASIDLEKISTIVAQNGSPRKEWKIVLQAQEEMHWLQAACTVFTPSPREHFRQAYANLVDYVEADGARANRALLCGCETDCMMVAVDR